jgi:class 3 adenylate cyclase/HAMP domain-containing protein
VRIRFKIIFVVLPLIVAPLFIMALSSIFTARNGITRVATEFQRFKAEELSKYAQSQWRLLQENGLSERKEFVEISKAAVESFARSMIRSDSELIFAVDRTGALAMTTADITATPEETRLLASLAGRQEEGWRQVRVGGIERVGQAVLVAPFGWYVLVTSTRDSFYRATDQILFQSILILGLFAVLSVILLVLFSGYLTRPLRAVVMAMRGIIASDDLSKRVDLLYRDETGELGHTFNIMTGELQRAYEQIKGFALETAIAKKRELKIRNIFQKFVPNEVIETIFQNPESMLVGDNRILSVLFSDIRGFTAISERMRPEDLVEALNAYFSRMVDVIITRRGIVDKYMGDAIMAFFGAPVKHDDDAYQSVMAGLDMIDALVRFNDEQASKQRAPFRIGIGINYGVVTVGNIGSEKKMDYTVIGDMVNLASRLEGLTKLYHEPMIISEALHRSVEKSMPCRMLDRVAVKGKRQGVRIYCVRRELSPAEEEGWGLHELGLGLYYGREFGKALSCFRQVEQFLPGDTISARFAERCRVHTKNPPGPTWDGVEVITEK